MKPGLILKYLMQDLGRTKGTGIGFPPQVLQYFSVSIFPYLSTLKFTLKILFINRTFRRSLGSS
jgi:hypothetical protein